MSDIARPKTARELLSALRNGERCEVVNNAAFDAAQRISGKVSYSFKLSKWNEGWAGFEPAFYYARPETGDKEMKG